MKELLSQMSDITHYVPVAKATVLVLGGFLGASLLARGVRRLSIHHFSEHHVTLLRRLTYWTVLGLFIASAMRELGFSLSVLMGAAGILTVAIGFASQTSASNIISGLFLVGERPFQIGDIIQVGNTIGEVLSIDLLSVKLRTYDNLFVRIPNETLIRTEMTNLTRFPIRRFDLMIGVAYRENMDKVRDVLMEVADKNPLCLIKPAPLFLFTGFGDSSLNIQFSVWAKKESFIDMRTAIQLEVKEAFDKAGIEIPFPHRTLYSGSETEPFPVRVISDSAGNPPTGKS